MLLYIYINPSELKFLCTGKYVGLGLFLKKSTRDEKCHKDTPWILVLQKSVTKVPTNS
jgi:hypothetical protein